jgi:hypothetical protein
MHFYQDWFDRRDGRLQYGFRIGPRARPSRYAGLLFLGLIEGPDCRNIGRCEYCEQYCLRRRKGRFFCNDNCSRLQSSKATKTRDRRIDREEKLRVLREVANAVNDELRNSKQEWISELRSKTRKLNPDISAKFITQVVKANEVPMPDHLRS